MLVVTPSALFGRVGAVLSALLVVFSLIGLTVHSDFYAGRRRRGYFLYFTNVSNLLVLLYFVTSPPLGIVYLLGIAAVAVLLVYEHWLVRPDDLARVNEAFFHVNAVISVGLFVVVLVQLAVPF